jgi:exosortase D (VPLPA-CTERM-specific)
MATVTTDAQIAPSNTTRALGILLIAAVAALFFEPIGNLIYRWNSREELSHSYFIPALSAWMMWECRDVLAKSLGAPSWMGVLALIASLVMLLLGKMIDMFFLQHIGFWVAIAAVILIIGGRSLLWSAWFPVLHLGLMIPPPYWVITVTSWKFQLWSSELGVWMIRLFDVPVLLKGNVIDLGVTQLQVVEACSGLNYLFPFFSIALISSYFYKGPLWQRVIIFFSAIPITILMNSFRIAVTGVLSVDGDTSHTEGILHFFEGWVVFLLCIALLLLEMFILSRLTGQPDAFRFLTTPHVYAAPRIGRWTRQTFTKVATTTLIVIGAGLLLIYWYNPQPKIPERAELANLNFELWQWKPRPARLDVAAEQVLGADDYIVADLEGPNGEYMNLYIAYLEAQRDGNSWHSPRQCLPGGGWEFVSETKLSDNHPDNKLGHPYNRILMRMGDRILLVNYWYQQRGRIIASELALNGWLIWDIATRRRSDGAMIRLITEIEDISQLTDAEDRLVALNSDLDEILTKYIPE